MGEKLKHRWSVGNNHLAGITADMWWRLLRENRFAVDPAYWHRAAFITAMSVINSFHRCKEEAEFHEQIAASIVRPPLFILGHWRSGTTLLHNLLAGDTRQFSFANTYQVVNPHTFLRTEETNSKRFAWMVPKKRSMDDMDLGFHLPQEDEFAPSLMSLRSPYLGINFPRHADFYAKYLTFDEASADETNEWKSAFLWFLKKLSLKSPNRLVLKSPPHTARIRLLLQMFPEASFVHIRRNPYDVFQSCRHYHDTATWFTYLQRPDLARIDDDIITRYAVMHEAYFRDRDLIPPDRFHEIRYEDLEHDPVSEIGGLYEKLQLDDFEAFKPVLENQVAALAGYRKNRFEQSSKADRDKILRAWHRCFEEWNYES